jgi:LacI family gluconate utilization system Gnt-I transcriptional repressor
VPGAGAVKAFTGSGVVASIACMPRRSLATPHARLDDVARLASVSAMTVSRALRSPDKVSAETRARIAAAIDSVGYVPNLVAGGLSSNRSNVAAAIVPSILNSLFASMLHGMSDQLRRNGYSLMVGDSGYSLIDEERLIESFLAQRPCGMFLHSTSHTERATRLLKRAGIPVIETGNLRRQPLDSVVSFSNFAAAKAMTLHLAARGYRKIAFVSLPVRQNDRARERRRGYEAALRKLGRPVEPALLWEAPGGFASGAEALVGLLAAQPGIDAVFFSGDVFAIGALLECARRGWAVPGRVAIAGFDDSEIATQIVPGLTTLSIPRAEIGQKAAQILLGRLADKSAAPERVDVGFSIVQRDST